MILAFYWVPILIVGTFTREPQERYVIHIQPFGILLGVLAVRELLIRRPSLDGITRWQARTFRGVGIALLAILLIDIGSGLHHLSAHTTEEPNYVEASLFVAARHQAGEPVIVGLPPAPYLALGGADDLIFLPGYYDGLRTERYTRDVGDHEYIDYWAGAPAIVSVDQLCQTLIDNPDAWLIVDYQRLNGSWAYAGDMAYVIRGLTYLRHIGPGGVEVRRVAPLPSRDAGAERTCRKAAEQPPPWVIEEQQKLREERT
jgi:hypothetical protein